MRDRVPPPKRRLLVSLIAGVAFAVVLGGIIDSRMRRIAVGGGSKRPNPIAASRSATQSVGRTSVSSTGSAPRRSLASARNVGRWAEEFYASGNYYDFVSRAARAALGGDGRAAFFVGEALTECAYIIRFVKENPDAEAEYNRRFVNLALAPQWVRDHNAEKFKRCSGLERDSVFSGLPPRDGGYSSPKYWHDLALSDGDADAIAQRASQELAADAKRESRDGNSLVQLDADLFSVLQSGDPEALFRIGLALSSGRFGGDPVKGAAIALAACDLGYDCSANNPENSFSACEATAACPGNADFSYYVQQGMGEGSYAKAYALAQEFEDLLARHDTSRMQEFISLAQPD